MEQFALPSSSPGELHAAWREELDPMTFDGNDTARTVHWLLPSEQFTHLNESLIVKLMSAMCDDQLDWILMPPQGYRI